MTAKLTLTVKESTIKKAQLYAKHTGRSLSQLIESYLETLTEEYRNNDELSPKLKRIAGAIKLSDSFDEKQILSKYFENKHL